MELTALKILSRPSLLYDLSLGTSIAKVGRLGAENGCYKQTDTTKIYILNFKIPVLVLRKLFTIIFKCSMYFLSAY